MAESSIWYLYLIKTEQNTLYTGISIDVERRFRQHQAGKGAKYLRGRGSLCLVYQQSVGSHQKALRYEYAVKQLSKRQKEALINRSVALQDIINID